MFIWVFHRVTGLLMILFLGVKFLTSFFLMTRDKKPDWALALHTSPVIDVILIICVVYHALYGLRTVIMDMGFKKEKLLFWLFTGLATALTVTMLVIYFTRDY